ncbi:MAG: hypothetical protein QOJ50_2513, partial [Cryptosporangiaceae bacterium]|nr:hypothetical protein [Cryptosporangiaceae bacterium]
RVPLLYPAVLAAPQIGCLNGPRTSDKAAFVG